MIDLFIAYRPLVDLFLLHTGYALGQYIVLRAGVFSVANAGLSAIGAYLAAWLTLKTGLHPWLSLAAGTVAGTLVALLLSWPLARLRGVYQAIATLAFVQVVLSLNIYAEPITGGALGLNNIPKAVGTWTLLIAAAATIYFMLAISATRIGRAFDAIRQDEAVASSLGVNVTYYQALAFAISGAVAGLFGGLEAFHGYALTPNQFGFSFLVAALSYVVLGGRRSVWGPVVGAAVLVALPEIARPLAENRMLIYGALLMLVIAYLPRGVVDTLIEQVQKRRIARRDPALAPAAA
jgi:branched-chain amino acid transport system permease protein